MDVYQHSDSESGASQFIRECHSLVRDLYRPDVRFYFADFLITYVVMVLGFWGVFAAVQYPWTLLSGMVASLAMYRCSIFIHEIQHQPSKELRGFSLLWNVLFGIPAFMPLFLYDEHVAHHSKVSYGTITDSEYMPLNRARFRRCIVLMAVSLLYPLLGPIRFGFFTPMAALSKRADRFVFEVMSSLYNFKPGYRRVWNSSAKSASRWIQEIACCLWFWFWGVLLYAQVISVSTLCTLYVIVGSWMFLNQLRTITAHRYSGDGTNQGMLEQLLDSNTFDRGWLPELWAPVGLRYHALHHLLPALPYHQLGKAHQRLLVGLPSDSPYHQTRQGSLFLAVLDSFHFGRRINFSNKI